jgi:hypothetical protein
MEDIMTRKINKFLSVVLALLIVFSIPISFNAVTDEYYTVTLTQNNNVKYRGVSNYTFKIKTNGYKSIYAKSTNENYYVSNVTATPDDSADVTYNSKTGEVFIENVTSDITLTPVVKEKEVSSSLTSNWELASSGNYDEENPAAVVKFTATLKDNNGNPVVNKKVYLKADESDKSYATSALTDKNGEAVLKYSYKLGEYNAVISADGLSNTIALNVVQQKKSDLYLTTNQVKASLKNTATGGVTGLDPLYEYYTSPLHQGAIVVGSGEWISPDNGTITDLAPGQYALRFKEYTDGNTIYLHSDYNYFTIDRAEWTVTADKDNSPNVTFADDKLYASTSGDIYYYVTPDNGYKITEYSVSNPNYISDISYNEDEGYIKISGVTGSVSLTVKAEKETKSTSVVSSKKSARLLAAKSTSVASLSSSEPSTVKILDVYLNSDAGDRIGIVVGVYDGNGNLITDVSSSDITTYAKDSTKSTVYNGTYSSDGETAGTFKYYFKSPTISQSKTYNVYASYNGIESETVTVNTLVKPTIKKTDLTVTNAKGNKSNGSITINSTYDSFAYYKQGTTSGQSIVNGNVITGLDSGTWYVLVAPYIKQTADNTYELRLRSSSATATVGQDEEEEVYYTVKFVNAAGETVSEKEYEEGTPASSVTVPDNTASYTEGNKIYSYSWGEIKDVTGDVTYNEIESVEEVEVKSDTTVKILDVYFNSDDATQIGIVVGVYDGDGNLITDVSSSDITTYAKDSTRSTWNKGTFSSVGETAGTFKYYFKTPSISQSKIYNIYVSYNGIESETVTVNTLAQPTLKNTDLTVTNAKGDNSNGSITINSTYDSFAYYKQGTTSGQSIVNGNVITGLDSGTWYVLVAPYIKQTADNTYELRLRSSSATATVGQDEEEAVSYTVKFVNAAGETVSEKEYEEGTLASSVTVPGNTESYTEGNKIYSYSWGEIKDVTGDVTYNEIESVEEVEVKSSTKTEIVEVYQRNTNNADGNWFIVKVKVTDENGNAVYENTDGYNVTLSQASGSSQSGKLDENGEVEFSLSRREGEYSFTAYFTGSDYLESESASVTVNLVKPEKPTVETVYDLNGKSNGKLIITSDYNTINYYKESSTENSTSEKLISNLSSGTYYVYVPAQTIDGDADYNFALASAKTSAKVEKRTAESYTVTTDNDVEITLPDYTENGDLLYNNLVVLYKEGATAWKIGDSVVAYGDSYSFRVAGDVTVTPITEEVSQEPAVIAISTSKSSSNHKVKFLASITGVDDYNVIEDGFVYGKNLSDDELKLENEGNQGSAESSGIVKVATFDEYISDQIALNYGVQSQTSLTKISARAYVIVEDKEGNTQTIYSDVLAFIYP